MLHIKVGDTLVQYWAQIKAVTSCLEEYVGNKVETLVQEILKLSEFAMSQPQAAYAAFSFGVRHKWTYFLRTIPDIEDLLQPLEEAIRSVLIPTLLNSTISNQDRRFPRGALPYWVILGMCGQNGSLSQAENLRMGVNF